MKDIKRECPVELAGSGGPNSDFGYCVYIHLFYDDLEFIARWLDNLTFNADLIFSVVCHSPACDALTRVRASLRKLNRSFRIFLIPNLGSDVLPFLILNGIGVFDKFRFVCKLHGKRTTRHSELGLWWVETMFRQTLIEGSRVVSGLGANTAQMPRLIGARDLLITDPRLWGCNKATVRSILRKFQVEMAETQIPCFFAGNGYWIHVSALNELRVLDNHPISERDTTYGADGAFGHAFERAISLLELLRGRPIADSVGAVYRQQLVQPGLIHEQFARVFSN